MAERRDDTTKSRREVLTTLAAGAVALPAVAHGGVAPAPAEVCDPAAAGPNARHFPHLVVTTHLGQRARFYEDLIAGRTVMVNFMSIAGEAGHPVTANLARAQRFLGDRLGREVFLYSLTVDPRRDTPRDLAAFARRHGAREGWLFLNAEPDDVERLKRSFFVDRAAHHLGHASGPDCSRGLVRYGNEATGLWGSCPAIADPRWLAARLAWVSPAPPPTGPPRRRGPRAPMTEGGRS